VADFKLPDLGEGVTEAEIERWLVEEGDHVTEDEPLVEVITDKATVEIPSPFSGAVARIHVQAGEVVPVGTVLVTIGTSDREAPPEPDTLTVVEVTERDGERDVKATPPVRRLARSLGVQLASLAGSGPGGRILRQDVEAAAGEGLRDAVTPAAAPSERRLPLRGIRRTIAERMTVSHRAIPAVTHVEECDVTELEGARTAALEDRPEARLTYLPFIVKAVVRALEEHPTLNASLDEDKAEIVLHDSVNIGIAVDTPDGLVVPVVHDAGSKAVLELAAEIEELAARARARALEADQLRGGTFTVTSPGAFGGLMATPIILHPQTGILGVHRAAERPVVRDGRIVIRRMMNLSISFDHRVLDGMTAARFVLRVAGLLEHPTLLALDV
jgi:pyruvate/2-oxoglutarate dehydrogenase complex dihydrolipoamide acyltransferase (E2) component